tara:strand:+ start:4463 stop:6031 length:1569 start_codon:yes stop_codon:yes gene_type:complete
MSNYDVTTNFGAKDSLPTGNAAKVIKGSEFSLEFNNIATASATKSEKASPTFTGTVTIPTADISVANTTTANITTANITTANCDDLTIEKAANNTDLSVLIHNTGTGDADAVLTLDSSATGESEINFSHDGALGAAIEYFVDGGSPDLNIKTLTSGSAIDLQPNNNLTLRAVDNIVTVIGDLRFSDGTVRGEIGIVGTNDVYFADNIAGLRLSGASNNQVFPCDELGAITDGVTDLGSTSGRFGTGNFTALAVQSLSTSDNIDCRVNVTTRGTGDSDAVLHLDANDTGEAEIEFAVGGTIGADVIWTTDGIDRFVVTTIAGTDAPIILEPNNNPLVSAAEGQFTIDGQLRFGDVSSVGATTPLATIGLGGTELFIADAVVGLRMSGGGTNNILPCDGDGVGTTEITNLGASSNRFKTIYSQNALNTSSDRTLKQSIEELNEAELRVAQSCKGLIRKFKWNKSVQKKGVDGSRYHVGVMAQDLEAAFSNEGLNAEEYGMFERNEEGTLSVSYSELLAFIIGGL